MTVVRIATRKSPLALWQANAVSTALAAAHAEVECELVPMVTEGDRFLAAPLTEIGGKNTFLKELEVAMLEGRADIAVHSMKDVTAELPDGLHLGAYLRSEDPRDAFVSPRYGTLDDLPEGAVLGTASSRRRCQVMARRPDLDVRLVRGNVNTRLAKLDAGEYDALLLAAAGLRRLGFESRIASVFEPDDMLPAVGQGVMGIECRADDETMNGIVSAVADTDTTIRVQAERAVNARLGGGCHIPLAAHAEFVGDADLRIRALVGAVDGTRILRAERTGPRAEAAALGDAVGMELLGAGAGELIAAP